MDITAHHDTVQSDVESFILRLTTPHPSIQTPERRRQAQLLSAILLTLVPLVVLILLASEILHISPQAQVDNTLFYTVVAGLIIGLYILSRTQHYLWTAAILIGFTICAMYANSISDIANSQQAFLIVIPLLLSAILLPTGGLVIVSLVCLVIGGLFIALGYESVRVTYTLALFQVIISAAILFVFKRHRDLVENDRQIESLRETNAALQDSEARWRVLVNEAPDDVYHLTPEGMIAFYNRNQPERSIIGKPVTTLFPGETAAQFQAALEQASRSMTAAFETLLDGNWTLNRLGAIRQDGQITGYILTAADITASKIAEQERERLQQKVIEAQKLAIRELSTPIIPLMDGIIVMPLIGSVDTARTRDITRALLSGITQYNARTVIIDITGVSVVDSGVADHLNKTIMAARLKGARTIITGISDAVAETIVDLGIDWSSHDTLPNLQSGLVTALHNQGVRLARAQ